MKNLSKVLIAFSVLAMVSCAKDYTCDCEMSHEQSGAGFNSTNEWNESTSMRGKEEDIKAACEGMSFDESYTDAADFKQTIKQKCTLK